MLQGLRHPNVLPLHCSFVAESALWLVMPYIGGGNVSQLLRTQVRSHSQTQAAPHYCCKAQDATKEATTADLGPVTGPACCFPCETLQGLHDCCAGKMVQLAQRRKVCWAVCQGHGGGHADHHSQRCAVRAAVPAQPGPRPQRPEGTHRSHLHLSAMGTRQTR